MTVFLLKSKNQNIAQCCFRFIVKIVLRLQVVIILWNMDPSVGDVQSVALCRLHS